jgi:hypothetical protein
MLAVPQWTNAVQQVSLLNKKQLKVRTLPLFVQLGRRLALVHRRSLWSSYGLVARAARLLCVHAHVHKHARADDTYLKVLMRIKTHSAREPTHTQAPPTATVVCRAARPLNIACSPFMILYLVVKMFRTCVIARPVNS